MSSSMIVEKARQRASVKWILSKAYNNRVPENQREPFYRDHEGQDHLKPQVKKKRKPKQIKTKQEKFGKQINKPKQNSTS